MANITVLGAPSTELIETLFLTSQSEMKLQSTEHTEADDTGSVHATNKKAAHQKDDALPIHLL